VSDVVTDTHGLIWYLADSPHLGRDAAARYDACDRGEIVIFVPTICVVEITYLQEKGRVRTDLKAQLDAELLAGRSGLVLYALTSSVADAVQMVPRALVPDMPDRIIAATALHLGLPLLSRDRSIQRAGLQTIW
jgi:PIN domain nuclease of toxin-antitoxin system